MNPQLSFNAQKGQQPTEGAKRTAEKAPGQKFERYNQSQQETFNGQTAKKNRHHQFPTDQPGRREEDKDRGTEHHADEQLGKKGKPEDLFGNQQPVAQTVFPGDGFAQPVGQLKQQRHRTDPGTENPAHYQSDSDRNSHAYDRRQVDGFGNQQALKSFQRGDKPEFSNT